MDVLELLVLHRLLAGYLQNLLGSNCPLLEEWQFIDFKITIISFHHYKDDVR
jgi:hypothetical protein